MVDDLLTGRVTAFRREQGFGVITLDDGRDVKFDASACTMVPEEGAVVRLRVGPARWGGGFKALHVEPRGSSTLFVPAGPPTLDQQIAALQREHLVGALSEHVMAQLVAEAFAGKLDDAALIDVIDAFYVQDGARARHDGYLRRTRPFHHTAGDILADIAALIPGAAIPRQLSWTRAEAAGPRAEPSADRVRETLGTLQVRMPDGSERALEIDSLDDIVALVNDSLRAAGDPRRLYPLETSGDWHAYLAMASDRARRLVNILPFATPPQAIN
jgi:cold shock CspA family protein